MATRITPTFLLKGVDPAKLLADYQAGFFSRQCTNKSKIFIAQNSAILAPVYGTTHESKIFSIRDKNNSSVILTTTGHSDCEVFTYSGGCLPTGGRCEHCKYDFTEIAVGYPVAYQELTALTNETDDPKNAKYRILYTFWVEGKFCTFECALGYIKLMLGRPANYRDSTINDSERLLKLLYSLTYPNSPPLRPAQDPRLLQINGGSLTKEEWNNKKHIYIRTDRVHMIPAKVQYIQQDFKVPITTIDYTQEIIAAAN